MPNYQNAKIYRLVCNTTGKQYIGSTTQTLAQRLAIHISQVKRSKHYCCMSREIIEGGNYAIILIEEYPCENRNQLERQERHYIETMVCVNKIIPTRTRAEYDLEHRAEIAEKQKQYHIEHRAERLEYKKQYRLEHRAEIAKYMKQYRLEHRAESLEKQKQYHIEHRAERLEYKKQWRLAKKTASLQTPPH